MEKNYLEKEFYDLLVGDGHLYNFIDQGLNDGLWYWDLDQTQNMWLNRQFWQSLGYDGKAAVDWREIIFADDLQMLWKTYKSHQENPDFLYDQMLRCKHKNGSTVYFRCRAMTLSAKGHISIRMVGSLYNMTDLKQLQEVLVIKNEALNKLHTEITNLNKEISELATKDYLTTLYNRQMVNHFILNEKNKSDRKLKVFSIFIIDINCFRSINDEYGHTFGDEVLKDFSNKLMSRLRAQDIKARWGSDEFLVILPETRYQGAVTLLNKFSSDMVDWHIKNMDIVLHYDITVGIAEYQVDEDIKTTIARADDDLSRKKDLMATRDFGKH